MRERSFDTAGLTRIAVFAAIIAVLGFVPPLHPFGIGVPITAQTLGVMLAGAVLGPLRGASAVVCVLLLVAAGLPLLSGGRGGIGTFLGLSGGYLIGWIFGAFVIGFLMRWRTSRPVWWRSAIAIILGGVIVIYAFGIPVHAIAGGISLGEAALSSLIFIPGDMVKTVLATSIVLALWRAYPRAFAWPARKGEGLSPGHAS